jgi:hypothetical protein
MWVYAAAFGRIVKVRIVYFNHTSAGTKVSALVEVNGTIAKRRQG